MVIADKRYSVSHGQEQRRRPKNFGLASHVDSAKRFRGGMKLRLAVSDHFVHCVRRLFRILVELVDKRKSRAQAWWELSPSQLGAALKTSFKLPGNPLKNPRTADEWEPYLAEKRAEVDRQTRALADAEAEINDRVFRLFHLTRDEITLLLREVEH